MTNPAHVQHLNDQIDASRRSEGRRRAPGTLARTRALAASAGVLKRTEQVRVVYLSPATHDELLKRAAELGVVVGGLAAYLIEIGISKAFPGRRRLKPNPIISCGCGCGRMFEERDADNRPRKFLRGHNLDAVRP